MQVLGAAPYLLYQAAYKGRALLTGGYPPLSFLVGCPPYPPPPPHLHEMRW